MLAAVAHNDALDVVAIELVARPCECSAARAGNSPAPRAKKQVTLSLKRVEERLRRPGAIVDAHFWVPRRLRGISSCTWRYSPAAQEAGIRT